MTFERLLETYLVVAPRGIRSFIAAMKIWVKEKLFLKQELKNQFLKIKNSFSDSQDSNLPGFLFTEHHQAHAAAAFFPSPFEKAVILCMDGVGEWATTSAWIGEGNNIYPLWEINFPHSIGLLYSAFTYYCGFKVNSGEYKLMGLAPYGVPKYVQKIKENLIKIKEDGTFKLDMRFFKYHRGFRMTSSKFHKLFGAPPRDRETEITQFYMDIAASIQEVTQEVVCKLANTLRKETGINKLCIAGGVGLNCVANGKLLREKIFDDIWIQPASGDAGSSLGAALVAWYMHLGSFRKIDLNDSMKGSYLGCEFTNIEIIKFLEEIEASFEEFEDKVIFKKIAKFIDEGKIIGWFSGPMEFGPRALGARSIIGDPRNNQMQRIMNIMIKFRESFRPFAPSILEEDVSNQFDFDKKSPYMLFVAPIKKELMIKNKKKDEKIKGLNKLNILRSNLPAITHIDYSSRLHTVSYKLNPRFYKLIKAFKELTGCPALINTSFNVRGEPIVCTPQDAYNCFMRTNMDVLVLENQLLIKDKQQRKFKYKFFKKDFDLD